MYKRIKTSDITPTVGMRNKSGMFKWIFDGNQGTAFDILKSIYPVIDDGFIYSMSGAKNTGTGSTYIISEGVIVVKSFLGAPAILKLNELPSTVIAGTAVVLYNKTYPFTATEADPVTFSDSSTHNVHELIELEVADGDGTEPNYFCDYSEIKFLTSDDWQTYDIQDADLTITGGALVTNNSSKFRYKIDGKVMIFQYAVNLDVSGTVTLVSVDLSSIFNATDISIGVGLNATSQVTHLWSTAAGVLGVKANTNFGASFSLGGNGSVKID